MEESKLSNVNRIFSKMPKQHGAQNTQAATQERVSLHRSFEAETRTVASFSESGRENWIAMMDRNEQRSEILKMLINEQAERSDHSPPREHVLKDKMRKLTPLEKEHEFIEITKYFQSRGSCDLNRFERLSILNLLHIQDTLVNLDEEVHEKGWDNATSERLQLSLQQYVMGIETFQFLAGLKQPGLKASKANGAGMAVRLHEPHYWDMADALNVFRLNSSGEEAPLDRLRLILQRICPRTLLDAKGIERRELDDIMKVARKPGTADDPSSKQLSGWLGWLQRQRQATLEDGIHQHDPGVVGAGTKQIIEYHYKQPDHISPMVDTITRMIVAVVGGLLLLVPMTVLSYITEFKWVLVVTFLFVIFFSLALAAVSSASNDQIMAATAAYGAVIVVFIANLLPRSVAPS